MRHSEISTAPSKCSNEPLNAHRNMVRCFSPGLRPLRCVAILGLPLFESGSACEIDVSPAESSITVREEIKCFTVFGQRGRSIIGRTVERCAGIDRSGPELRIVFACGNPDIDVSLTAITIRCNEDLAPVLSHG